MSLKDEEIQDQSETLNHLEGILQKTADRYAAMVDKERWRLETNVNFGVQVAVPMKHFSQQADFIVPRQGKTDHQKTVGQEIKASLVEL